MARHNELETMPHRWKLARSVFAGLLVILPLAATTCFARPAPQGPHPRFENNQQAHLGPWLQRHGNLPPSSRRELCRANRASTACRRRPSKSY